MNLPTPLSRRLLAAGLAGAAFLVFTRSLSFGFVYDDASQVLGNPWIWHLRHLPDLITRPVWSFKGDAPSNYYRPVQMLLYVLEGQAGGRHPFAFHLASVLSHAFATVAAYALLRRVTDEGRAALAALLFAVHPAHVESVAWIAGSTDVDCALLTFTGLLAWSHARGAAGRRRAALAAAAGGLFFLALWAKETAVVLPLLALLLPPAPGAAGAGAAPRRSAAAWIAAVSVAALALYLVLRLRAVGGLWSLVRHRELSGMVLLASGLALLPRYLLVAFAPWRLVPDRVFVPASGSLDPWALGGALILAGGLVLAWRLSRSAPAATFGIGLLLLPLLPVLQVQYVGTNAQADRYLYIPSLGACLLIVEAAARALRRLPEARARGAFAGICGGLAILAAARSVSAEGIWRDDETLARAGIALEPRTINMRMLLVGALDKRGRIEEAFGVAAEAAALAPDDRSVAASLAGLRAEREAKSPQEAIAILQTALRADPLQPYLWGSLSAALLRARMFEPAVAAARKALELDPSNVEVLVNLASAYGALHDFDGQEREARRALEIDPGSALAWLALGLARFARGDLAGFEEAARRAASIDPDLARAHLHLSFLASARGSPREAMQEAETAVRLDPKDASVWEWMGVLHARRGDREGARRAWERSLALDPESPTLARKLRSLGGIPGAAAPPGAAPSVHAPSGDPTPVD